MRLRLFFFIVFTFYSFNSFAMCCSCGTDPEDKIIHTLVIDRKDHSFKTLCKYKHRHQWTCNLESNPDNCIEVIDKGLRCFTDGSHKSHLWEIQSSKPGTAVVKLTRTKKNQVVEEQLVTVTVND